MHEDFKQLCAELEQEIIDSYTSPISIVQAEKLAGKFLDAQMKVAEHLRDTELDMRMKKAGAKSVAASVFLAAAKAQEKKPSDGMLTATVDCDRIVCEQRDAYDKADVLVNTLERYYNIFREAHIFFRGQAKQSFG